MLKKFIHKNWTTLLLVGMFVIGLSLLLYPSVANWWNSVIAAHIETNYQAQIDDYSDEDFASLIAEAKLYNSDLLNQRNRFFPDEEFHKQYKSALNIDSGMMGTLKIPSLRINLPIYHGTDESVLQTSLGHLEGTSLPVGGESTHTVISGHRGLPSAKLLTEIDKLQEGDIFIFKILNEKYTYQVDQIRTVLPEEIQDLEIVEGQDLATLVTCTPYGINSHRLLVRGHRIENLPDDYIDATSDASIFDRNIIAVIITAAICIILVMGLFIKRKREERVKRVLNEKNH